MARLLFVCVAVIFVITLFSSEIMSLPVGENPPELFEESYNLLDLFKNDRECKKIAEVCYRHEECCSFQCPSYWGKCVS
uniref:Venom polypeptide n=1 Tax=Dolopus genitalis TaxID=2488630 RepID=A0A3G5BID1_DOLGE|nr:venom polypeptide [Dolopus genitalis]